MKLHSKMHQQPQRSASAVTSDVLYNFWFDDMKKMMWLFVGLLVLAPATISAQERERSIDYHVQSAQFRINDTLNIAEIYFSIPRGSLAFVRRDSLLEADFEITTRVLQNGRELSKYSWLSSSTADSLEEIRVSQMLFSMTSFQMKAGNYLLETSVLDVNSQWTGSKSFDLTIEPFGHDSLAISEVELVASLKRSDQPGRFHKNGYQVIPNPRAMYGDGLPILMFYAEIYNLSYPSDATYSVHYRIVDANGDTVKSFPDKEKAIAGTSLVEAGGFNIISLPSGNYHFVLKVRDNQTGTSVSRKSGFFVYRARDQRVADKQMKYEAIIEAMKYLYRDKSEADLDHEFDTMRWLTSGDQSRMYKDLDVEAKKDFLIRFWRARDPDTTTVINEFRNDYFDRVQYATDHFGGIKSGYLTDRGRVLLVYGKPDEIENFPSSNDVRAYQIWHYYSIEGGVKYYFVDIRGWGDFELVNSTARNELSDPDWQRWLSPTR